MLLDPYDVPPPDAQGPGEQLSAEVAPVVSDRSGAGGVPPRLVDRALDLARTWGRRLPEPGQGRTRELWQHLADVAALDLTTARVLEPHLDALAILGQAARQGHPEPGLEVGARTWGVFAAEGPEVRVAATGDDRAGWRLTGRKPWCSLAGSLDAALVTAWCPGGERRLFAVDLRGAGVGVAPADWVARGLMEVTSGPVDLDDAAADPVGPQGWYLSRPGFAWGGVGVAACWLGGAVGLARTLAAQGRSREPDQIARMHLGAVDAALHTAGAVLALAADAVDRGQAEGPAGAALALRVRRTVRVAAEEALERADHALGPGPLVSDAAHSARVADLRLYLRQEHAERDEAALGRLLTEGGTPTVWGTP